MNRRAARLGAAWAALALAAAAGRAAASTPAAGDPLLVPLSVRQVGGGDATLPSPDLLSAWSNPALLDGRDARGEVAFATASLFGGRSTLSAAGGAARLTDRLAAGGFLSTYGASVEEVDDRGEATGAALGHRVTSGGALAALSFGPVAAGVALKGVSEELAGSRAFAGAADLGLRIRAGNLAAAVAVRNLGPRPGGDLGGTLPLEVRVGVGGIDVPVRTLSLGGEYAKPRFGAGGGGGGVEWRPRPWLALRAGVAWKGGGDPAGGRFGLSSAWGAMGLDYAAWQHPLGTTHLVSLTYRRLAAARPALPVVRPRPIAPRAARPLVLPIRELPRDPTTKRWKIEVRDEHNRLVRTFAVNSDVMPRALEWDGRDAGGTILVNPERVRLRFTAIDVNGRAREVDPAAPAGGAEPPPPAPLPVEDFQAGLRTLDATPRAPELGAWWDVPEIPFSGDATVLAPAHAERLRQLARLLTGHPAAAVAIESVAQPSPNLGDLEALARRRADLVLRALLDSAGLKPARIVVRARVASRPQEAQFVRVAVQPAP